MVEWILANLATILISIALIGIVTGIIVAIIKGIKKGKSSCGCSCSNCPMAGKCHTEK